jgi:hypothetical protein
MERNEILARLDAIRDEVRAANPGIIRRLIVEEHLYVQVSSRRSLAGRLVNALRRRLLAEVELGLRPVLDRQREIHLRLLKELEELREELGRHDHGQRT